MVVLETLQRRRACRIVDSLLTGPPTGGSTSYRADREQTAGARSETAVILGERRVDLSLRLLEHRVVMGPHAT